MLAGQVIRMKPKNKLQTVDCIEEVSQRFERLETQVCRVRQVSYDYLIQAAKGRSRFNKAGKSNFD